MHAIRHLRTGNPAWDARAYVSIHISVIFGVAVLLTGAIWAKASWGKWWVWDEPTLVSFLIVFLLYCTYYPLRYAIEDRERQARYASVFAIMAGAFVPLNFLAVRLAQTLVHPRVFATSDGGLPATMCSPSSSASPAMALLWLTLVRFELAAKSSRAKLGRLRRALEGDEAAAAARGSPRCRASARGGELMPALPLDEAGKYVAGAYVVFLALLLVYVAIMASRLARIDRELGELAELAEDGKPRPCGAIGAARCAGEPRQSSGAGSRQEISMAELLALGISHKTAPLELRERLALTEGRAVGVLGELVERGEILEAAAISTCNRTELYLSRPTRSRPRRRRSGCSPARPDIRPTELVGHLYSLRGVEAAEHLFRVTAGLDSMIIGEAEIQGQVKRAYELALVEGATGPVLNRLFRGALAAGKRARTETGDLASAALSIPSVAVELAQRTLGDLDDRRVLVVGAGETAELTARALAARGVEAIFIANRHYDRAIGLAERFGGHAVRFEELPEQLDGRRHRRLLDQLAAPRDRARGAGRGDGGPRRPAAAADRPGRAARHPSRPAARSPASASTTWTTCSRWSSATRPAARPRRAGSRASCAPSSRRFERWLAAQEVTPTIAALRARADEIVERVLAENEARWEGSPRPIASGCAAMARAIASRLLARADAAAEARRRRATTPTSRSRSLRELFGLDPAPSRSRAPAPRSRDLDERRSRQSAAAR